METTGNSTFNRWVEKHGQNYLSHATKNYKDVLKTKVLCCAEDVLRGKKSVDHEGNGLSGQRVTIEIDHFPSTTVIKYLSMQSISKKRDNTLVTRLIYPKFSEEALNRTKKNATIKEYGEFTVSKTYEKIDPEEGDLSELPTLMQTQSNTRASIGRSLAKDEEKKRPIDKQLREIYAYVQKKGLSQTHLHDSLSQLRSESLNTHTFRVEDTISVAKNKVWWSYGPVAILIGKPEEKVRSNEMLWGTSETRLKASYQVDDGFYREKIDSEENIVLGPKYILDQYRNDPSIDPSVKARLIDIESLTPEQWPLFGLDEKQVQNLCKPKEQK